MIERINKWREAQKESENRRNLETTINTILSRVTELPYNTQVEVVERIAASLAEKEKKLLEEAREIRDNMNKFETHKIT